jgi:hypothetical protein
MSVMLTAGELCLVQKDGGPPTTLAAGSAPGESGVSVLGVRFRGGAHVNMKAGQHLVCFVSQVHIECRMAGRANAEHVLTGTRNEAMDAGCIAYLRKLFAWHVLRDAIGKAVA